jgi:sodium-dependent phosphate transporter
MRNGIANPQCYVDNPGLFMYCMAIVCMMTGVWLFLACYLELPVSTTHSAVGGIIGMTMMSKGIDCVIWNKSTTVFPYFKGVSAIVFSWVWSPILSGRIKYLYTYISTFLHENSKGRLYIRMPINTIRMSIYFYLFTSDDKNCWIYLDLSIWV